MTHLQAAVSELHGAPARHLETVRVREVHAGAVAWEGEVEVFALEGHPQAERCYAWIATLDDGTERTYAVLHVPPVDSPSAAVRAAIVADYRAGRQG